ncbi:MAG: hypothetical protein K6E30_00795 [Lachnospiraceae bacterium]|nr:hypothetical protein [Lachnospiraceae bacterium]
MEDKQEATFIKVAFFYTYREKCGTKNWCPAYVSVVLCCLELPKISACEVDFIRFEELMNEIEQLEVLPNSAIWDLPKLLGNDTKRRLCRLGSERAAQVLANAIDRVNAGSVERLDVLVKDEIKKR